MTDKPNTFWQNIIHNKYRIPQGYALGDLTETLLEFLGSPDYELRDEFAYMILANWIHKGFYEPDQLRGVLGVLLNNLQYGLGEFGTDSIFLRSFSALMIGTIVDYDNSEAFLRHDETKKLLQAVLDYFVQERDGRGYDMENGWMHSVAHVADCLLYFARSQHIGGADLEAMLNAIGAKLSTPMAYAYHHDEDERLALATANIFKRKLVDKTFVDKWLFSITQGVQAAGFDMRVNGALQNPKNYLRSLYFQLALSPNPSPYIREIRMAILTAIQRIHRYIER